MGSNKNCVIKIFYNTESLVIQGAKCVDFSNQYFQKLKHEVITAVGAPALDISETEPEITIVAESTDTQTAQIKTACTNDSSIIYEKDFAQVMSSTPKTPKRG